MKKHNDHLQHVLDGIKTGKHSALDELRRMGDEGESWCYHALGDTLLFGRYGFDADESSGRHFLRIGFDQGIDESGHVLAKHLKESGEILESRLLFEGLSRKNSVPSIYQLGRGYLANEWGVEDERQGLSLLKFSASKGHLPSRAYLHWYWAKKLTSNRRRIFHIFMLLWVKIIYHFTRTFLPKSKRIES